MGKNETAQILKPTRREFLKLGGLAAAAIGYYTLSLPVSTVIISCDSIAQLEENVQFARDFTPLSEAQMGTITQKAEPVSKQALFFRFFERA